jgi:hypothetical protein
LLSYLRSNLCIFLLQSHENDHSVRAQVGCFRTFSTSPKSGCFPAKSRGKEFLEANHIRRSGPLASFSHKSSREIFVMLINGMYLEYGLGDLVRYLS